MKNKSDYIVPIGCEGLHVIQTGNWRKRRPVLLPDKCTLCGRCLMYCPVNSIIKTDEGRIVITYDYCKGCGICANECRSSAIHMIPEEEGK
jgi:2-oxoacid:acceptor oxidoreductase delta subunit (pyruvate/2-ketoisovalerate family)